MSVALITGAAGDIGRAVSESLAAAGHRLVLADHPSVTARLHEVASRIPTESQVLAFDVTSRDAVADALDSLASSWLPTLVFNNAGIQGAFDRVDRLPSADVERVISVNVVGAIHVLAESTKRMIASGVGGAVVNTASMAGVSGAPNMAAYAASKAAVIGLTKSCAKDLAPTGIRVNAVSPAFIGPGAMWDRQVQLQAEAASQYYATDPVLVAKQMIDMVPLRRYGATSEVADVVSYLLSDKSSYLTGVNIEIAGGSS